jgi:uncharacterized CHY-type Zn-finger protein
VKVYGAVIDKKTRCRHYHSERDIIAIKFACCGRYYPCYQCHMEMTDHPVVRWPVSSYQERAILCGHCQAEWSIEEYLTSGSQCPGCHHPFNSGCQKHWPLYFELPEGLTCDRP